MSATQPATSRPAPPLVGFADRRLPRRVRQLLEGVYGLVAAELERWIPAALADYEAQLFSLADQARSTGVQSSYFQAARLVRQHAAEIPPVVLARVEHALATVRDGEQSEVSTAEFNLARGTLALVEDVEIDQHIVLKEIAARAEMRNSLPLFLLGQRFGVLAAKPGYDAESLPVGPARLCHILDAALGQIELGAEYRHLLLRQFDKQMVLSFSSLLEAVNSLLAREGVLPHITHIPFRARPRLQAGAGAPRPGGEASADGFLKPGPEVAPRHQGPALLDEPADTVEPLPTGGGDDLNAPMTRWPGLPASNAASMVKPTGQDQQGFDVLRQLLSGRRSLVGKLGGRTTPGAESGPQASPDDLQTVLERMQHLQAAPVLKGGKASQRSVTDLKQDLLVHLRTGQADGGAVALKPEDNDTIELIGLLLDHLSKDVRPGSPIAGLLTKLQIPLLRVALQDKSFFTQAAHPARQLLNSVAETSEWLEPDDPQDQATQERIQLAVDKVLDGYQGDPKLFEHLTHDIGQHLQVQFKRAEVAEKRHVEAARGKEKLELARVHANEAIGALLGTRKVPRFTANLIGQSWADVLALTLLRHGEESEPYRHKLEVTERLLDQAERRAGAVGVSPPLADSQVQELRSEVEQGLLQVGYHADEAQAAAARLVAASDDEDGDGITRTELAARLKTRARFGEQVDALPQDKVSTLQDSERAEYERLKRLPFGCWFEFIDEGGRRWRRRLSWYSPITGHSLFINHRGQRVGEYSLAFLAREIVAGRVKVLTQGSASLVDRAWQTIVGALRSFANKPGEEAGA